MKFILFAIIFASVSGCYQSVNNTDISRATAICKGTQRIEYIEAQFGGRESVKCVGAEKTVIDEATPYEF